MYIIALMHENDEIIVLNEATKSPIKLYNNALNRRVKMLFHRRSLLP
jgi:hypothetical protein